MKRAVILVVVLAAIIGGVSYWWVSRGQGAARNQLPLTGHIEATQTDLGFKVTGTIVAIHFVEGDWVKTGQVVAELDAKDLRDNVAQAQAKMDSTRANLTRLENGYRPQEVQEAGAAVAKAEADLYNKRLEFFRMQNLLARRVVPTRSRDRAEADFLMAQAALKSAREQYDLMKEGYRQEDIEAAKADLRQTEAALALAQTRLSYATIASPVDGVVLVKPAEVGEVAAIGANVLTLGLLNDIWFEGYIPETDLAKVRYGMKAEITTDAYPGKKYPAWVSYISGKAEFTPKTVETFKERVNLVYRTKIRAGNPNHELKPGMPAEAVIFLDSKQQ